MRTGVSFFLATRNPCVYVECSDQVYRVVNNGPFFYDISNFQVESYLIGIFFYTHTSCVSDTY